MKKNARTRFLIALVIGAFLGAFLGAIGKGLLQPKPRAPQADPVQRAHRLALENTAAWRYAQALLEGQWETVATQLLWVEERLSQLRAQGADEARLKEERTALTAQLSDRQPTGNFLRSEGIEDQYIFTPGITLEPEAVDSGLEGLAAPTAQRLWVWVRFPQRARAVRDESGLPIRAMRVGINVDAQGRVLKANIIGNVEIDLASLSFDWTAPPGE